MNHRRILAATTMTVICGTLLSSGTAQAVTTVFFSSSQTTNLVESGTVSDTISSERYLFTFTRDKLFTGGIGLTNPVGRYLRVLWPDGLEAQAVTAGPIPGKAKMVIERQDGQPFAIESFTARLLANTAGAGAAIEVMPMLGGEDGLADPIMYGATGYYGSEFLYSTPELTNFDAYKITLYVDFAIMRLTVVDDSPPDPILEISRLDAGLIQISWATNATGFTLESTTNLPTTAWQTVTNRTTVSNNLFAVTLSAENGQRIYRLRK